MTTDQITAKVDPSAQKARGGNSTMPPEEYLDLAAIADLAGIGRDSMKTYHKRAMANRAAGNPRPGDLPREDIRLGRTPGWERRTVTKWLESRPRAGKHADDDGS